MIPCRLCNTTSSLSYRDMYIIEDQERGLVSEQPYTIYYGCQHSRSTELLDAQGRAGYLAQFANARKNRSAEPQPELIAIDQLYDNPYQSRSSMDEEGLAQLAETITSQGFQGVLVARPHPRISGIYQLTAGHRRRDAARLAGLKTLPVIVRTLSNHEMAVLAATENLQREDLTPLDEGRLFQRMMDELDLKQAELVRAVNKHRNYVRHRLRLAQAPQDIQDFVASKPDSLRAVIHLLDIEDPAERARTFELLRQKILLTDDLPAYVEELHSRPLTLSAPATPPAPDASSPALATSYSSLLAPEPSEQELPSSPAEQDPPALSPQLMRQRRLREIMRSLNRYIKSISVVDPLLSDELALLTLMGKNIQILLSPVES